MSKTKHPDHVVGWRGTLSLLARAVGRMLYSKVAAFVGYLAADISRQAEGDLIRGRDRLSRHLYAAARHLQAAQGELRLAWQVCKPHMKKKRPK